MFTAFRSANRIVPDSDTVLFLPRCDRCSKNGRDCIRIHQTHADSVQHHTHTHRQTRDTHRQTRGTHKHTTDRYWSTVVCSTCMHTHALVSTNLHLFRNSLVRGELSLYYIILYLPHSTGICSNTGAIFVCAVPEVIIGGLISNVKMLLGSFAPSSSTWC